ncbi:MAG: Stk1 family PASTA domain-containing Ser/Thr kinase [Lachnospiraceae bacterium]|nr:Stk1 family PASTA domain-containing Ser/Thr kinase [Lachnospiraceae bacterium]
MSMIKPGTFIGDRYEILEKIGSGGMADVYKAKCHRLNRYVAIKILKPEFSGDKNFVTKFRGEAQSCAGLTHPNIVSVYDVGDAGDLHYFVMEYVEGITLKRFIERKGRLDLKEAVGIAIQIAQGLDVAHQNHVVHRDIKPQNIIISKEGKVKVADFGIARAATTTTTTHEAQNIGSVHYLSPEQARGGYSDERSDIYSLGVTMYEMLAGRVPFTGDNAVSVALLHIQGEATPLSEINPEVTPSLEKIIAKCMQKKPERRYMSTTELIADLKAAIVNPTGDFVKMMPVVNDSPTKNFTASEMSEIHAATAHNDSFDDDDDVEEQRPSKTFTEAKRRRAEADDEDDEDLDSMGGNMEKIMLLLSIVMVLAVAIGAVYAISKLVKGGWTLFPSNSGLVLTATPTMEATPTPTEAVKSMTMPSYKGQDYNVVIDKLKAFNMNLQIEYEPSSQYSDDYETGTVIGQIPEAGSTLIEGDSVKLIFSIGKEQITIGNYKGYTEQQVRSTIGNKLSIRIMWMESDEVDDNLVVKTEPKAGEKLIAGDTLVVYLNSGNTKVTTVPNVVGMNEVNAMAEVLSAKLKYDTKRVYSSTVKKGDVISQEPAAGGPKVNRDSVVVLTISDGPEPTATPTPMPTPTPTVAPTATPTTAPAENSGGGEGNEGA